MAVGEPVHHLRAEAGNDSHPELQGLGQRLQREARHLHPAPRVGEGRDGQVVGRVARSREDAEQRRPVHPELRGHALGLAHAGGGDSVPGHLRAQDHRRRGFADVQGKSNVGAQELPEVGGLL